MSDMLKQALRSRLRRIDEAIRGFRWTIGGDSPEAAAVWDEALAASAAAQRALDTGDWRGATDAADLAAAAVAVHAAIVRRVLAIEGGRV